MTWTLLGWALIILAAVLLGVLSWGVHLASPPPRKLVFSQRYKAARGKAIEQGKQQLVILGNRFWSSAYPGLGLTGLFSLSALITPETMADGGQALTTSSGSIASIARQVVAGKYTDGFSRQLTEPRIETRVPGLTPFTFTAALLSELKEATAGNLLYLGDFGPEAVLAAQKVANQGGQVFIGAGSITAQATLFLCARDLLLGEQVYMLSPALAPTAKNRAGMLVEDVLRVALMLLLITGAVLKMCGVL